MKKVINKAIPPVAANVLPHPIRNAFIYFSLSLTFSYLQLCSADSTMESVSVSGSVMPHLKFCSIRARVSVDALQPRSISKATY